jgi:hypothetical protein
MRSKGCTGQEGKKSYANSTVCSLPSGGSCGFHRPSANGLQRVSAAVANRALLLDVESVDFCAPAQAPSATAILFLEQIVRES